MTGDAVKEMMIKLDNFVGRKTGTVFSLVPETVKWLGSDCGGKYIENDLQV